MLVVMTDHGAVGPAPGRELNRPVAAAMAVFAGLVSLCCGSGVSVLAEIDANCGPPESGYDHTCFSTDDPAFQISLWVAAAVFAVGWIAMWLIPPQRHLRWLRLVVAGVILLPVVFFPVAVLLIADGKGIF
jgi:hypothetical protein